MITVKDIIKLVKGNDLVLTSINGVDTYELGNMTNPNYGMLDIMGRAIPQDIMKQQVFNIYAKDKLYVEYGKTRPAANAEGSDYCVDLFEGIFA